MGASGLPRPMRETKFPKTLILAFAFPTQKYCQNVGYILFVPFSFSGANRNFQIDSVGQLLVLLALNHGKNLSRLVLLSTPLKSCTIISRESLNVGTTWDDRKRAVGVVSAQRAKNGKK